MKTLIQTLLVLAPLALGCSAPAHPTSSLNSSAAPASAATDVEGKARVLVIGQHDYVALELKGDDLGAALYTHLSGLAAVTEGDDGDYTTFKTSKELSCGGDNMSGGGEIEYFDEIYCVINFSRAGKAGPGSDDPFAWANATLKTGDMPVTVHFENGTASVELAPSADSHVLFDALTALPEVKEEDEEISHKVSSDVRLDYDYSDGDDYSAMFKIDTKGMLTAE